MDIYEGILPEMRYSVPLRKYFDENSPFANPNKIYEIPRKKANKKNRRRASISENSEKKEEEEEIDEELNLDIVPNIYKNEIIDAKIDSELYFAKKDSTLTDDVILSPKYYLFLGDSYGTVKALDLIGLLKKNRYEPASQATIKSSFNIKKKDDINAETIINQNYNPKGEGYIDAKLNMKRTPLSIIHGFIPDQLFGLKGTAEGDLSIKGSLSKPNVNGELYLENTFIFSEPYGMEVKVADDPIRIVGSNILFENFEIQDANKTPLNISGYYDFSDFSNMKIDLKMRARNFMIINAKENLKSEAFGKAFVNFFGSMKGPVDAMTMRGRLDVLGSTDMTYVLRDSPLTADTRLEELVKFVNFNDTIEQVITRPPLTGFNMDLTMSVDEGARIKCDLNSDHSNYIDLVGGGNLRMRYNPIDNLQLTGRYILHEAEMKYSLPVIPLKTFTIQEGSYIDFKGDPMNPTLNITATENRKASVANEGGGTRSVDFTCGVVITQTLNNMGLEFIINAPDDVAIGTELASMSLEERGKVAVTMLTTGMYLADGNTSGFTMNGALSSFLQNEINNITGNALRTLDLSVGVDNATDASGAMHTDYSFKFAKRFWNNRLRIIIGGKVSTGSDVPQQDHSFLTNVTFEYRLSATSNKYLKLFYNRDSYDWLEGQIGEYGGGFLWRRKLDHFMDIFKFKSDSQLPPSSRMPKQLPKDTISTDSTSIPKRHENPED